MFGKKLVSQSLIDAVKGVTSAEQKDAEGTALSEGSAIRINEGNYAGRRGVIIEFLSAGKAKVQLSRGPAITTFTSAMVSEDIEQADESRLLKQVVAKHGSDPTTKHMEKLYAKRAKYKESGNKDKLKLTNDEIKHREKSLRGSLKKSKASAAKDRGRYVGDKKVSDN